MEPKEMLWDSGGPKPRQPVPGEPVWSLRKNHETLTCELRAQPVGVEAQCFRNREFLAGRLFNARADALAYADGLRRDCERLGWTLDGPDAG
jgi:hypothetical protein